MMAIIQGAIHFQSIALNYFLKNCGVEPSVLIDYSTPNFRKMMEISTTIMGQDSSLYADILMKNPECSKTLEMYLKSCNQLYQTIIDNNKKAFISYFQKGS
jgi:prephenate dehydrogenase